MISQIGCVALNIPSERLHDPADHGGLLGDWQTGPAEPAAGVHGDSWDHPHHDQVLCGPEGCEGPLGHDRDDLGFDGGPLESDPWDPCDESSGARKPDDVPWPRFHPVPTRPVFGGPSML